MDAPSRWVQNPIQNGAAFAVSELASVTPPTRAWTVILYFLLVLAPHGIVWEYDRSNCPLGNCVTEPGGWTIRRCAT